MTCPVTPHHNAQPAQLEMTVSIGDIILFFKVPSSSLCSDWSRCVCQPYSVLIVKLCR